MVQNVDEPSPDQAVEGLDGERQVRLAGQVVCGNERGPGEQRLRERGRLVKNIFNLGLVEF